MALSPDDQQRHDYLVQAAAVLRQHATGEPVPKGVEYAPLADAVEYTLSSQGVDFLGRLRTDRLRLDGERRDPDPNLPIRMPKDLRDLIRERSDGSRTVLTRIVEEGFVRFLDGTHETRRRPRESSKGGPPTVILSVTPPRELHAGVATKCRRLNEEGSGPRLTVSTVAASVLYEHFKIGPFAPDTSHTG